MKTLGIGALLAAIAAAVLFVLDRRSRGRHRRRLQSKANGLVHHAVHLRERPKPQPNDATLVAKVESEVLGHVDLHEGHVNVNAENGVVVLRGQLDSAELIDKLAKKVRKVHGVQGVENLLHLPGAEAPMHQARG
jgi:osmotically-inducible protein OsmY